MNVYITQEYDKEFATVNSLWAAARQHAFIPDRVYLLTPGSRSPRALRLQEMLGIVQQALGRAGDVQLVEIDPNDLAATRRVVQKLIKARDMEGAEIAVDVTPGRTIPKLALFQASHLTFGGEPSARPRAVFYLSVGNYDYRPQPYVLIPFRIQQSRDLAREGAQ